MSTFVTIKTYGDYFLANIVKNVLSEEGIYCHLKDENSAVVQWSGIVGGIKLQVKEEDKPKALQLIKEMEEEAEKEKETVGFWEDDRASLNSENRICIHCGSKNTRRDGFDKIHEFLDTFMGIPKPTTWHCFHCGLKF